MSGVDGFGTQLKRGDGAGPEVFTALARITGITPPGISRETYETTAHDTVEAYRTFLGGLKDGGEVSIDVRYNPALHDVLLADFADVAPRNYKIVFPTDPVVTWTQALILTAFEPEAPFDDLLSASLTFKVSGKPTSDA